MWPLCVTLVFGLLVIVPCWRAFMSALLLEKDPEKWDKWQAKENERRQRRDERIAQAVHLCLWVIGWLERKLMKPSGAQPPLDASAIPHRSNEEPANKEPDDVRSAS